MTAITFALASVGCGKKAPPAPPPPEVLVTEVKQHDTPIYNEYVGQLDASVNFMNSVSLLLSRLCCLSLLLTAPLAVAQGAPASPTLKSVLLEQLRTTHNQEEWFVPVKIAIEGLTPEQAAWKDPNENHSIVQLVNHLIFWNQQQLAKFNGEKPAPFSGDNKETFAGLDKAAWETSVKRIDEVLSAWEKAIEEADESKLAKWYSTIAKISTHNAYHTGQIIYIRKMKGNWDPAKGVK